MQEIELKFQIPALALSAVQAELTALDGGHHAPGDAVTAEREVPPGR